jgi:glycosyltransferase involved in cell wall biosynthesis
MGSWLIIPSLQFLGVVGALVLLDTIIGANLYDARQIASQRNKRVASALRSKKKSARFLVTILVSAHNNETDITRCLESITKSSYRKYQTIIIDNNSTDSTVRVARTTIASYPKKQMKLVARKRQDQTIASEYEVYKKYGKGDLVLRLDASNSLDRHALASAVRHFSSEPLLAMLRSKKLIQTSWIAAGLIARYQNCLREISLKSASVNNADVYLQEQAFFRADTFAELAKQANRTKLDLDGLQIPANRQNRSQYAEDVLISVPAQTSLYRFFTATYRMQKKRIHSLVSQRRILFKSGDNYTVYVSWLRLPLAVLSGLASLIIPLAITYFIYLAVRVQDPVFLVVSCGVMAVILLFAIWGDRQFSFRQKVLYSLGIPMTYLIFYAIALLQYLVIIGGLVSHLNEQPAA